MVAVTVREWFRLARSRHTPSCNEESEIIAAIRTGDWNGAEFWYLLWFSQLLNDQRDERGHLWYLDEYVWRCTDCSATIPSDVIGETEPPLSYYYDEECQCAACRPCQRSGQ